MYFKSIYLLSIYEELRVVVCIAVVFFVHILFDNCIKLTNSLFLICFVNSY